MEFTFENINQVFKHIPELFNILVRSNMEFFNSELRPNQSKLKVKDIKMSFFKF